MTALSKPDWRLFLCLVVLGLIGTWVPLFDLDEGAFLEATRELLDGGHWAATTLDGEPRYDKPILSYWLQASSLTLFGWLSPAIPIEIIGRLPSVIAGALWAVVLGRFSEEITKKPGLGVFVALALATTLGTSIISRAATADAILNLWLALLFTDIARYILNPSGSLRLKVFLWLGLGILTKGPVAVIIPACAFGLWVLLSNQWSLFWSAIQSWAGWALMVALLTPWLIGVYDAQGYIFFEKLHSTAQRGTILWQPPWSWWASSLLFVGNAVGLVALLRAGDSGSDKNPRILGLSYQSICADLGSHCSSLSVIIRNSAAALYLVFNRPVVRALRSGLAYPKLSTLGITRFVCSCINTRVWFVLSPVTGTKPSPGSGAAHYVASVDYRIADTISSHKSGLVTFEPNRVSGPEVASSANE